MFKAHNAQWRAVAKFRMAAVTGCILSLSVISGSHAEVYKWVDAAGQTHYSERKADTNGAKTAEVKILPSPKPSPSSTPTPEYWRELTKPASSDSPTLPAGTMARPSPSLSGGVENGTDESRCALARDVLSGAVRHSNGKPIDRYDRDVAQNDIKAFCRKR